MSTIPASGNDDFREQLSAWHDGALPDEASRFVLKRLLADEALRAEVGRWQAVGDVLRRHPAGAVRPSMAARVATAIEAAHRDEASAPEPARAAAGASRRPARLRWWASAAVVGMAAVLLVPGQESPVLEAEVALQGGSAPRLVVVESPIEVPLSPIVRSAPRPLLAPQPASFEPAALLASVPPLVRAPQPTPEQLAPLPATEVPSRPWPRSSGAHQAFTVEFVPPAGDAAPRP